MNRVLGIVGSPRKTGNTYQLVHRILQGAHSKGAEAEIIYLSDHTIHECDGCHACWKGKGCNKNDDMVRIYPRISESDVLVLGTPVYWYGPTALMKAFIDRFIYFNSKDTRERIRGATAVIAVPFEDHAVETADLLVAFFTKCFSYLEVGFAAKVLAPGVTKRGEVRKDKAKMDECFVLGKRLAKEQYNRLHAQAL